MRSWRMATSPPSMRPSSLTPWGVPARLSKSSEVPKTSRARSMDLHPVSTRWLLERRIRAGSW